jgi:hypothetical protein
MTKCGQAMAGLEVGSDLEVPVLDRVRHSSLHSLVEKTVDLGVLAHLLQPVPGEHLHIVSTKQSNVC